MVQSISWEANWFAASQEIPRISRNPKVHYSTHKRPTAVSILGQPNPVHIPTPHLLEIHPNIIHPSTPNLPSGLLPSDFPSKTLYTPLSSHTTWTKLFYHKIRFRTCKIFDLHETATSNEQDSQWTYKVIRGVRVTNVTVEHNKYHIFRVCVCSLRYPACNAYVPYWYLWPVRL